MKHGAQETAHISAPPSGPIPWGVRCGPGLVFRVDARTWFEARAVGMRLFRCEPGEVQVWPLPVPVPASELKPRKRGVVLRDFHAG